MVPCDYQSKSFAKFGVADPAIRKPLYRSIPHSLAMNGDETENTGVNRTGAFVLGGSLRLFATPVQRNDPAVLSHGFNRCPAPLLRGSPIGGNIVGVGNLGEFFCIGPAAQAVSSVLLSDMHGRGWSNSKALWPIASGRLYPASCRQEGHLHACERSSSRKLFQPLARLTLDRVGFYGWLIEP
jgi:hypothetical protein